MSTSTSRMRESAMRERRSKARHRNRSKGAAMSKRLCALAIAAVLAGCAVTQPKPPTLDVPEGTATAAQSELLEHWWIAFDDPVLTALIDEAFAGNLDLRAAIARIESA